jgi:hypothetical protein
VGFVRRPLASHTVTKPNKTRYFYYRCGNRVRFEADVCTHSSSYAAPQVEAQVWSFVNDLLKDPERLRVGFEERVKAEREAIRHGAPEKGSQRLAARGYMTDEARGELKESRRTVQRDLEALQGRCKVIEDLERNRDAILESYASMVREELQALLPEDRHRIYKMLRPTVTLYPDRRITVTGAFVGDLKVGRSETAPFLPFLTNREYIPLR